MKELGPDVPLHFSAFHPDYKLDDATATPKATLSRASRIAMGAGLRYVYTGNVHDRNGGATHCPGCGRAVIERDWYEILTYALGDTGHCQHCGAAIAGRFGHFGRPFGSRRIPVSLHARRAGGAELTYAIGVYSDCALRRDAGLHRSRTQAPR
jgi:pyruvate formate lyase activating enzyme